MNNEELKELAAVLNGIADGKAWEYEDAPHLAVREWFDGNDGCPLTLVVDFGRRIRLKQWKLPDPPHGYEWHRTDWTKEMLPERWRPLLLGESVEVGDEVWLNKQYGWNTSANGSSIGRNPLHPFARTRRPLPPPKPQLREVELCADDIKAGDEFLSPEGQRYQWGRIDANSALYVGAKWREFKSLLAEGWKIRSIGETEWRKCSKQEEVPA